MAALSLSDNYRSDALRDTTPNIIPMDAVQMSVQKLLESRFQKGGQQKYADKPPPHIISPSRKSLPHNAHERKQFLLLDSIESDAREIANLLDISDSSLSDLELRTLLDSAAGRIRAIGITLVDAFKHPSDAVSSRKQRILETLRSADSRVSQLGALFSELDSTVPVRVDSGKYKIASFCNVY